MRTLVDNSLVSCSEGIVRFGGDGLDIVSPSFWLPPLFASLFRRKGVKAPGGREENG